MLRNIYLSLVIIFVLVITILSCSDDNNPSKPSNKLPVVEINLQDSLEFGLGSVIRITADAYDEDGLISEVEFFVNSTSVKTMSDSPYFYDLNTTEYGAGEHVVKVIATDDSGAETSAEIILFVLTGERITLISPLGGEIWGFGTIKTILWTDNIAENVKIDLYKGSVLNMSIANTTESTGSYEWTIPDSMESGTDYKVRVTSIINNTLFDESTNVFSLLELPIIKVITPDGNALWNMGTTHNIIWEDNISENVKIDLYKGSVLRMSIVSSTESTGYYEWAIPDSIESGTDYKIKITSVDDPTVYGEQTGTFTINPYPSITVISPSIYEIWNVGAARTIKWSSNFIGSVKIELFKNDIFYKVIADSTNNTGNYNWVIPNETPLAADYKIKITNKEISTVSDLSDESFKISMPLVSIYDPPSEITNSIFKVQWYGNSNDSTNLSYYYCVTTDTTLTNTAALAGLNSLLWKTTQFNYANVSFPYAAFNSGTVFVDSTTFLTKIVYSKFFVYAIDVYGSVSEVKSKVFGRINQEPKYPMVYSSKLHINGSNQYWFTVGPDSSQIILPEATEFWQPLDFKWMGEDPDGDESKLEFKWELWERTSKKGETLVTQSNGWSTSYLSKSFDNEIYDHNKQGNYAFKVYVRDDALEESLNPATVNFSVFAPTFEKGILLIDDTDPILYPPQSSLIMGNPDASKVKTFYEDILEYAGYKPEGEAVDSLSLYRIKRFEKLTVFVGWEYYEYDDDGDPLTPPAVDSTAIYRGAYSPDVKEILKYRLVVFASDDRSNTYGVDWTGEPPYIGYAEIMKQYLDVGGKAFMLGNSALMGELYVSPDQLPVNVYAEPFKQIFDTYSPVVATISSKTKELFRDYFGIYSMTFPEAKTYYTIPGTSTLQYCSDHYLAENYDFIGITKLDNVSDIIVSNIRIDSTKVNDYWYNVAATQGRIRSHSLKDNGTVFTGVPTFEVFKGERIYRYESIYDLPKDDSLSYEISGSDTLMTHYLWCKNKVTGEIVQPVLQRSGTLATRYVADNDQYRTAFFGLPTYFMDNSGNQISDMFKAMIDWFDLSKDPLQGFK